jgi:cytochrome c-type biogenesis protein CcmH/NrfG
MIRDLEKAREQFDLALEKDPTFAYAWHGIGVCFVMKGNLPEAEKSLRAALKLDEGLARARLELAKLHVVREDLLSAQQELLRVLDAEPGDLEARAMLGHVHLRRKDLSRAVQEFRAVLSRAPGHRGIRKALGVALAMDGKAPEAAAEFRLALDADPGDFETYVLLKNLLEEQGDAAGAAGVLARLLEKLPAEDPRRKEVEEEVRRLKEGGAERGPLTLEGLVALLESPDVARRREAMAAIIALRLNGLPRQVVRAVKDTDESVRVMAVSELGRLGGPDAVGLLEVLMRHPSERDASPRVRGACARALADIRSPAAVPVLVAALDEEEHYVFCLVSEALSIYTGLWFTAEPTDPVPPEARAEVRGKWRAWYDSPRSFSLKLMALAGIEEIRLSRLVAYVAELIGDSETTIAKKALRVFFTLTGESAGAEGDLEDPGGRARSRERALAILEARRKAAGK